jgi:metal-responsive CopG/Arc/MetJ family transcriptional regulator
MPRIKIAISLAAETLERLDRLVQDRTYPNRSRAIETAITDTLARLDRVRLARECARLDPAQEKELAEEGFSEEISRWPKY